MRNFNKEYFSKLFLRSSAFLRFRVVPRFAEKCRAVFYVYPHTFRNVVLPLIERAKRNIVKGVGACRNTKEGFLVSAALIIVGGLFFVGYVKADNSTTSVTVGNSAPTLTVTLDRTTITPVENSYVWASTTLTITDGNGCSTIGTVEASLVYASSTVDQGANICGSVSSNYSSWDVEKCYAPVNTNGCVATTTGTTCATTVVDYDCGFQIWYSALPSDASSPVSQNPFAQWVVVGSTTDNVVSASATNTTQTVEVATLNALNITGTIAYAETAANANTGTADQTATVTNTGNTAGDTEISGDVMCTDYPTCAGNSFTEVQQKFDLTSGVDYSAKTFTMAATSSPATIETILATTTATTTAVTEETYWGIGIPSGQSNGAYTGANTFTGVAD